MRGRTVTRLTALVVGASWGWQGFGYGVGSGTMAHTQ